MNDKPTGSGWLAVAFGVLFVCAFVATFFGRIADLSPEWIFRIWLICAAGVLLGWGRQRIKIGNPSSVIGQETLNFVVGVMGVTAAILALLIHS
ncbi:hypothetical protein [Mesorhizobium sp. M0767]|uniref:hypothetical protein n=1 Tax=Mesorhizobium sp. M0767 TaxID=2956995 RepID=UPI0033397D5A